MKTLYSPTAAARLLRINPARLQRWLNFGHFRPEYRAWLGDQEARLLTEEEINRLKEVVDLINAGTPVQQAFALKGLEEPEDTVTIDL